MSELRIAVVAEGPTDLEIIQAALNALLPTPFTLTQLQPEPTLPDMGTGWGGVLKWCEATSLRHHGTLDTDPTLAVFDLVVIHLDADVAHKRYGDCGHDVPAKAQIKAWHPLPCDKPCPPASDTCGQLQLAVRSWLSPALPSATTVLCIPAQATGAWLAAAVLPPDHNLLQGLECNLTAEARLSQLPKVQRIHKSLRDYRKYAPAIHRRWDQVKRLCRQAAQFKCDVLGAIHVRAMQPHP